MCLPLTVSEACARGYLEGAAGGQRPFFCTSVNNFYLCAIAVQASVLTQPGIPPLHNILRPPICGFLFAWTAQDSVERRVLFFFQKPSNMFSKLKSLWAGFSGELTGTPEAKLVWLLLICTIAGFSFMAFMGWGSYPAYIQQLSFIPGAGMVAALFAASTAFMVYFSMQYVTGYFVEIIRKVPMKHRNFNKDGAIVIGLALVFFLALDQYMQVSGLEMHVDTFVGEHVEYKYDDAGLGDQINSTQAQIDNLLAGAIDRQGWRDPKTGKYHLNGSGNNLLKSLQDQKANLLAMDLKQREIAQNQVAKTNGDKDAAEAHGKAMSRHSGWVVPILMALLGLIEMYCNESIEARLKGYVLGEDSEEIPMHQQLAAFRAWQAQEGIALAEKRPIGFTTGENVTRDNAMQQSGNLGNCKHCGHEFTKRTVWHEFCTPACRTANWEVNNPGKKATHARNASDAKA